MQANFSPKLRSVKYGVVRGPEATIAIPVQRGQQLYEGSGR